MNERLKRFKPLAGVEIRSEVFFRKGGGEAGRREAGSLGIDVLVVYKRERVLAFDLKFGKKMSKKRETELESRINQKKFNVGLIEIMVDLKDAKKSTL